MADTKIQWATKVWNPVTGCSPVSPGCQNCYAKRMANRLRGRYGYPEDDPFQVTLHPEKLREPLRWRKSQRIFVNSMSDLFHDDIPFDFVDSVFSVMLACQIFNNHDHIFMILTKRPQRMLDYFKSREPMEHIKTWAYSADSYAYCDNPDILFDELVFSATCHKWDKNGTNSSGSEYKPWGYLNDLWPLQNVWLGVTVENQQQENRIIDLLNTPAAVRLVSAEPMLGPIDFERIGGDRFGWGRRDVLNGLHYIRANQNDSGCEWEAESIPHLDWVICGGETSPGARPMHPDWVRSIRDQSQAANVPFFFKQYGEWLPIYDWNHYTKKGDGPDNPRIVSVDDQKYGSAFMARYGKKIAGDKLDGKQYHEFPEVPK